MAGILWIEVSIELMLEFEKGQISYLFSKDIL